MVLNTSKSFTIEIENIAKEKQITHMEAVLWYCRNEGIDLILLVILYQRD